MALSDDADFIDYSVPLPLAVVAFCEVPPLLSSHNFLLTIS